MIKGSDDTEIFTLGDRWCQDIRIEGVKQVYESFTFRTGTECWKQMVKSASALGAQCWRMFSTRFPVLIGLSPVLKLPQHSFSSAEKTSALVFQCWKDVFQCWMFVSTRLQCWTRGPGGDRSGQRSLSTGYPVLKPPSALEPSADIQKLRLPHSIFQCSGALQHWITSAEKSSAQENECWHLFSTGTFFKPVPKSFEHWSVLVLRAVLDVYWLKIKLNFWLCYSI